MNKNLIGKLFLLFLVLQPLCNLYAQKVDANKPMSVRVGNDSMP